MSRGRKPKGKGAGSRHHPQHKAIGDMRSYLLIRRRGQTLAIDVTSAPDEFFIKLMKKGLL